MENQYIIFGTFLLILVIVFGALYYYYKKMKQAELLSREVQKHLLIQKKIIENHDKILHQQFEARTNASNSNSATSIPEEFHQSFATMGPLQTSETPETTGVSGQRSPPINNPMERVLPLVSSLMGNLFQNEQPSVDDELSDVVRDKMEELKQQEVNEMKKKQMENEITEELEELNNHAENVEEEGRVDDISIESEIDSSVSVNS